MSQYRLRLHTLSNESVYVGDDVRNFRLQGLLDFDRKRSTLLASPRIEHFSWGWREVGMMVIHVEMKVAVAVFLPEEDKYAEEPWSR